MGDAGEAVPASEALSLVLDRFREEHGLTDAEILQGATAWFLGAASRLALPDKKEGEEMTNG